MLFQVKKFQIAYLQGQVGRCYVFPMWILATIIGAMGQRAGGYVAAPAMLGDDED